MIAALGPVAQGWVFILGFGITFFVFGLTLYRAFDGLIKYGRDQDPGPDPDIGAGGMTHERREGVLRKLLSAWVHGDHPVRGRDLARLFEITPQQAVAFMHWANGQTRERHDGHWQAIMERGIEESRLRFRPVPLPRSRALRPIAGAHRGGGAR